jgi:hypothetical protein
VTTTVYAQISGLMVPVNDCDWVLFGPCGCPWGVATGRHHPTEEQAWEAFYEDTDDQGATDRARGVRLELMTHARYSADVYDRIRKGCNHLPSEQPALFYPEAS